MSGVLVDSNIIIDIVTENESWFKWSALQIEKLSEQYQLFINPIIYAEISIPFETIEEVETLIPENYFISLPITKEVCFLSGKAFRTYRKNGGTKKSPLPDFFIGAHAAILNLKLLTRDTDRYATYFPIVELVCPK